MQFESEYKVEYPYKANITIGKINAVSDIGNQKKKKKRILKNLQDGFHTFGGEITLYK
jgi:hypothetical protein